MENINDFSIFYVKCKPAYSECAVQNAVNIEKHNLIGDWKCNNKKTSIIKNSKGFILINEFGDKSEAFIKDHKVLVAQKWNVTALLCNSRLLKWDNNTTWIR